MNRRWWFVLCCFIAATGISLVNLFIHSLMLYLVALWLVIPMAIWGLVYLIKRATRRAE